jgi:hypothetical protein
MREIDRRRQHMAQRIGPLFDAVLAMPGAAPPSRR